MKVIRIPSFTGQLKKDSREDLIDSGKGEVSYRYNNYPENGRLKRRKDTLPFDSSMSSNITSAIYNAIKRIYVWDNPMVCSAYPGEKLYLIWCQGSGDTGTLYFLQKKTIWEVTSLFEELYSPQIVTYGNRVVIVDGIGNSRALFVEIDRTKALLYGVLGVPAIEISGYLDSVPEFGDIEDLVLGTSIEGCSAFQYLVTQVSSVSGEGNPSPLFYTDTNNRCPLMQREWGIDGIIQNVLKRQTISNIYPSYVGVSESIKDKIEYFKIYRRHKTYSDGVIGWSPFYYVGQTDVLQDHETSHADSAVDGSAIVSWERDVAPSGDDVAVNSGMIFISNSYRPLDVFSNFSNYTQVRITNKNQTGYGSRFILKLRIFDSESGSSDSLIIDNFDFDVIKDFTTEQRKTIRIYDQDAKTPCPVLMREYVEGNHYLDVYVWIPYGIEASSTKYIYICTGGNGEGILNTPRGGKFVKENEWSDQMIFAPPLIRDTKIAVMWRGKNGESNLANTGWTFFVEQTSGYTERDIPSHLFPTHTIPGASLVQLGSWFPLMSYTAMDWEKAETKFCTFQRISFFDTEILGGGVTHSLLGWSLYDTVTEDIITLTLRVEQTATAGTYNMFLAVGDDVPLERIEGANFTPTSGLIHCEVYFGVDVDSGKLSIWVRNIADADNILKGEHDISGYDDRRFHQYHMGNPISSGSQLLPSAGYGLCEVLLQRYYSITNPLDMLNIEYGLFNSLPLFDTEYIGYTDGQNNNIKAVTTKSTTEEFPTGLISWSDSDGLSFPDLNVVQTGSKISRIFLLPSYLQQRYENTIGYFNQSGFGRFQIAGDPDSWQVDIQNRLFKEQASLGLLFSRSLIVIKNELFWVGFRGIMNYSPGYASPQNITNGVFPPSVFDVDDIVAVYCPGTDEIVWQLINNGTATKAIVFHYEERVFSEYGLSFIDLVQSNQSIIGIKETTGNSDLQQYPATDEITAYGTTISGELNIEGFVKGAKLKFTGTGTVRISLYHEKYENGVIYEDFTPTSDIMYSFNPGQFCRKIKVTLSGYLSVDFMEVYYIEELENKE